jgi:hypothetical protein
VAHQGFVATFDLDRGQFNISHNELISSATLGHLRATINSATQLGKKSHPRASARDNKYVPRLPLAHPANMKTEFKALTFPNF